MSNSKFTITSFKIVSVSSIESSLFNIELVCEYVFEAENCNCFYLMRLFPLINSSFLFDSLQQNFSASPSFNRCCCVHSGRPFFEEANMTILCWKFLVKFGRWISKKIFYLSNKFLFKFSTILTTWVLNCKI